MTMTYVKKFFVLLIILIVTSTAIIKCSYSFTGASVPPHLNTIAIPSVIDRSGSGEFDIATKLTELITRNFINDNTLQIGDRVNSDSILECTITSLSDAPAVLSGGETITTRRITVSVRSVYKDLIKRQTVFERTFSSYGDYLTSGDIFEVRKNAIDEALDKIAEDILLGVVSNW